MLFGLAMRSSNAKLMDYKKLPQFEKALSDFMIAVLRKSSTSQKRQLIFLKLIEKISDLVGDRKKIWRIAE